MNRYVLIEVSFEGYSRYLLENDIMSIEVFNKYEIEISNVLNEVWYSDFNGKHGHVDGVYNIKYLTAEQARSYFLNDSIEGLERCFDSLCDELDSDIVDEIREDISNVQSEFKNLNFVLDIDLSEFKDVNAEKTKVLELLLNNGYKVSHK